VSETTRREELELAIETRKELGAEHEPEVVDAFLERIDQRLAERGGADAKALKAKREHQKEMILGSMGISIPLLAIAAIFTGLAGVIAVCAALAVIAIVVARSD
jgi:hypothetical protein